LKSIRAARRLTACRSDKSSRNRRTQTVADRADGGPAAARRRPTEGSLPRRGGHLISSGPSDAVYGDRCTGRQRVCAGSDAVVARDREIGCVTRRRRLGGSTDRCPPPPHLETPLGNHTNESIVNQVNGLDNCCTL
jgi:hypothetical protein